MELLKVCSAQQDGKRGLKINLPAIFFRAAQIGPGDKIGIWRRGWKELVIRRYVEK